MTTIKFLLLFIACCCVVHLPAQKLTTQISYSAEETDDDHIAYTSSQKLTISDFKGQPKEASNAVAITASGFSFKAGFRRKGNVATLNITVSCSFDKRSSWMKDKGKTAYVLQHEQHHFDISYLGALDFMERLKAIKFTIKNYNEKLNTAYQESVDKMEAMQHQYDGETQNGIAKEQQIKWNQKFGSDRRLALAK